MTWVLPGLAGVSHSRAIAATLLLALGACAAPGPRPIAYDSDGCSYCRMTISDRRYGAELVTAKGRVHTFDSIECLVSFYLQSREGGEAASVWVSDYSRPGTLVAAERAVFVRGGSGHSPMGLGLAAFGEAADTAAIRAEFGGGTLRWTEVLALVERNGIPTGAEPGSSHAAN